MTFNLKIRSTIRLKNPKPDRQRPTMPNERLRLLKIRDKMRLRTTLSLKTPAVREGSVPSAEKRNLQGGVGTNVAFASPYFALVVAGRHR